ncbi:MAG: F0F1 ATP synthase subunit epsilon [Anderseniella sp.]|jgi:F-type H+-transporting ATPase subunit epsilon|nr:F0F1 ATP synthase subunit epsilon [Anderseniella sp.]
MADLLKFELVSPERLLSSGDVQQVVVPGTEGEFTVLVNHAPVLSTLKPGVVTVTDESGNAERIFVRGGFAEVNPAGLTILAEEAVAVSELSADDLAQKIQNAREDVTDAKDPEKKRRAQETLDHLTQLQSAL